MVLRLNPTNLLTGQRPFITKLLSNMGKIHPRDKTNFSAALSNGFLEGVHKRANTFILDRRRVRKHGVMKRRDQDWDNGKVAFASKYILKKQRLEFQRMFNSMENLLGE